MPIQTPSLDEVLASTFQVLFPHLERGEVPFTVHSRASDGDTPLHVTAWRNDVARASILLSAGADVDAIGDMSETPLHVAVRRGQMEMIELLLKAGADPDLESDFGRTARDIAELEHPAIARFIRMMEDARD